MSEQKIDTEIDTCTCIEELVKCHLIDSIAKIVDDYTKKYKFKGKIAERIDLSYTVCCDENKKYDHATTILLNIAAVDDEIFILNNCFNISVYNHINKQITREYELDTHCANFHHYSITKYNKTSRVWEISNKIMQIVKMFISKPNNELLLYIRHLHDNKKYFYDGHIFVFNSLNGNFIRRFMIYEHNVSPYTCLTFVNVTFDGVHLFVIDSSRCNGIMYVNIVNILDGSIVRKWENEGDIKTNYLPRVKASAVDKNNMYFVGASDKFSDQDEIYKCNAIDGKNMQKIKDANRPSIIFDIMVYDNYVYTFGFGVDDNYQFKMYDNVDDNNENFLAFCLGLYAYQMVLHYGKMILIKKNMCLKGRTWLEKSSKFNIMFKSGTSFKNDEITDDENTNDENTNDENTDDENTDDENTDDENTDDEITDDEKNSCLDIENNRIKIPLYVIY